MAQPWTENEVYSVTMDDALADVPSLVGDKTLAVFLRAGFKTVGQLYAQEGQEERIKQAIITVKAEAAAAATTAGSLPGLDSVWRGLHTRCLTITARVRCAEAQPVPPAAFCCPITYELMTEPVVTKYGYTYERTNIVRHLETYKSDPLCGLSLTVDDLAINHSLRDAIAYHQRHYMRFAVPLHPRR